MLENEIERWLAKTVKKKGGLCYKFESPGNAGVPDRIIITPKGRIIFVELKNASGRLQSNQKWQIDEMRKRGADVRVVKGLDAAKDFSHEQNPHTPRDHSTKKAHSVKNHAKKLNQGEENKPQAVRMQDIQFDELTLYV